MKTISRLAAVVLAIGFLSACSAPQKGYNYKKHHKKSMKAGKKKAPADLTKYNCRSQR